MSNQTFTKIPFPAYDGDEAYMYVCYAHRDAQTVFEDIKRFHDEGFNIWYDGGLSIGIDWENEIIDAILNSSLFVLFISRNSVEAEMVRQELQLAVKNNIPVIPIFIENVELEGSQRILLSHIQAIMKFAMSDEDYIRSCIEAFSRYLAKK